MGSLSDRTSSRWGRRRPYLLIGALACAASMILLFADPFGLARQFPVSYVLITLCGYAIAYTAFSVPYIVMSYEITSDRRQRTTLMSFRVYATSVGGLVAQALAPWIITRAGGGMAGFAVMAWILAAIILIVCLLSFFMTSATTARRVLNEL